MNTDEDTTTPSFTIVMDPEKGTAQQTILAIQGIANALHEDYSQELNNGTTELLIVGLYKLANELADGLYDIPYKLRKKIERAVEEPDAEFEVLQKELHGTEYMLCVEPGSGLYGLLSHNGRCHLFMVGAEDIRKFVREHPVDLQKKLDQVAAIMSAENAA